MFTTPDVMQAAAAMSRHAAAQQAVHARNIAHADTPGYQARVLPAFADTLTNGMHGHMRTTRTAHLDVGAQARPPRARIDPEPATRKPNGNTVSLEHEMMHAARARLEHETALGLYATARNILRTSLGR